MKVQTEKLGTPSKSSRIRALHREGRSVREIAKSVGVPYHHAYSVLHQAGLVGKASERPQQVLARSVPDPMEHIKLIVDGDGKLIIPEFLRGAMGVWGRSDVTARVVDGELRVITPEAAVKRAQKLVRELIPGNDSLADSLIADRRREVAREQSDG